MAQVTPGANENSSEDVGLALGNARALEMATEALIMMVDHSGKDASKGVRGWSGKRAAADAEHEVLKYENGTREIRVTKMKDGDDEESLFNDSDTGFAWQALAGIRAPLSDKAAQAPGDLSTGQQQRVGIARAIVHRPALLLADEPTGNLDTKRSAEIMELLQDLNVQHGITVLMVTHEPDMAAYAKRMVRFVDGLVESDVLNPHPVPRRAAAPQEVH